MKEIKADHKWIPGSIQCPINYLHVFYALILPGAYPTSFTPFQYVYALIFYHNLWKLLVKRHSFLQNIYFGGGKPVRFYPGFINNFYLIPKYRKKAGPSIRYIK